MFTDTNEEFALKETCEGYMAEKEQPLDAPVLTVCWGRELEAP